MCLLTCEGDGAEDAQCAVDCGSDACEDDDDDDDASAAEEALGQSCVRSMTSICVAHSAACLKPADEAEGYMKVEDEVEDDNMLFKRCREHAHDHNQASHSQDKSVSNLLLLTSLPRAASRLHIQRWLQARTSVYPDLAAGFLFRYPGSGTWRSERGGCSRSPRSLASKQHGCHLVTDRHVVIV